MKKLGLYLIAIITLPLYFTVDMLCAIAGSIIAGFQMTAETFEEIVNPTIQ